MQQLNGDQTKARDAQYGAYGIDQVIKDWKPTIWLGVNDIWSFNKHAYMDKPWYRKITSVPHITIDSIPVLDQALEQAAMSQYYLGWTKFAMNAMKRYGPKYSHVDFIYGASDTSKYSPVPANEAADLRKRFNISPTTTIFIMVGRNQLRKSFPAILKGLAEFKRENPLADVKVLFHTAFHEQGQGWNLPKLCAEYGVNLSDVLATYVCKQCGQWHVHPFVGEDIDCPYCGAKKSMATVSSFQHSVPHDEMKYVYSLANACISAFTSGGQEYHNNQSLLCGKPLACTNYSCGEDFCEQPFVFPLGFEQYHEPGNSFIKAATHPEDIKRFMKKVWQMTPKDVTKWGEQGQEWAAKTFHIDTIGAQWEKLFSTMPHPDWATIDLTPQPKNESYPFPEIEDADQFITALYTNILKMDEKPEGSGRASWHQQMKAGVSRKQVYEYFIGVAKEENKKAGVKQADFWDWLDKTTGKKRGLILIKESIGDIFLITSLFKSFHEQHPDTDLYVMCDEKYRSLLDGNEHVFRTLPYIPAAEQEMLMTAAGQPKANAYFDVFYHTAIQTQRLLSYLSQPAPAFSLEWMRPLILGRHIAGPPWNGPAESLKSIEISI